MAFFCRICPLPSFRIFLHIHSICIVGLEKFGTNHDVKRCVVRGKLLIGEWCINCFCCSMLRLSSSKSTIKLSILFQNVSHESLDDIYCWKYGTSCNFHVLEWQSQPCVSSLLLDSGCPVVIAAAIPCAMLLPTDACFKQEVPGHTYDGLACHKYVLRYSNTGSWLAKKQKSRLRVGGRRLLFLNDETWCCHQYTHAL
jgi:hypothetical protein